jgi:adenylate cyclase
VTPNSPSQRKAAGRWIGAVAGVLLGWFFYMPFFGQGLTNLSYDLPLPYKRVIPPEDIVIIYLDADSRDKLNQRFEAWDRKLHAQLLRKLKEDGSREVAFDLIFDQPSVRAEDDAVFAAALREHGKAFIGVHYRDTPAGIVAERPIPPLATNATVGATSVLGGGDVVRELFCAREIDGQQIVTFAWMMAERAGAPVTKVPGARERERWLNYYGPPERVPWLSYYDAISNAPPGFFNGKFVLVGSPADIGDVGAALDTFKSPYGTAGKARFAGVEIQATALANLLHSEWLHGSHPAHVITLGAFGLLIGLALVRFRPLMASVLAIAAAVIVFALACLSSWKLHFWFPWLTMVLVQIPVAWSWSVLHHWVQGQLERQFLEQSLSMYLSPKLVKKFSRDKDLRLLQPGATKQKLTIIFSDIASFTSISEGMDSDELAKMMNEYFEGAVGGCIHVTDGTVVKYIGDAIFAFWNAPEPQADHAVRACDAALRFREMSAAEVRGKKLITRIGLHTGVANVGNFGSATRVDYTAIGEDVNLASRMEGLNKYLGTTVLMTGAVKQEIGDQFVTRYLGRFQLKGFERAVEVHELLARRTDGIASTALHDEFDSALRLFQQRDLNAAETAFQRIYEARPQDGSTQFYLKHIGELRTHSLPENWHGEVELKEK